jgi:hypothetical protein
MGSWRWYLLVMGMLRPEFNRPETDELPQDVNGDRDQIAERLGWTPKQRLQYLVDMLGFEERAHRARQMR